MATSKSAAAKKAQSAALPENHTGSQAVAHAIVTKSIHLAPSVNRIMEADLSESGRLQAITLFRDSLDAPGDPNRHPAKAIENARLLDPVGSAVADPNAEKAD